MVGAQLLLGVAVQGGHSVAYNWRQTVTTNVLEPGNNAPAGSKINVPFNDDRGNPSHLYWNPTEQKNAMDYAARKHGGSTMFYDEPHLKINQVPKEGWSFDATLELIGIAPNGEPTVLQTWTWGFNVDKTGRTTLCPTCSIQP
jgi:hypothetical protein